MGGEGGSPLTYPITSSEAECSFSKLKLLLAPTRSTMSKQRINYLALMSTHRNRLEKISTGYIIKQFKQLPRKANLGQIFVSLASDVDSDQGSFYLLFFSFRISFNHYVSLFRKSYLNLLMSGWVPK